MRRWLPLLGLLLLAACAQDAARRGAASSAKPPLAEQAGRLPAEVAGFSRGASNWHESERPGLGVTVSYAGPSRAAVATVSLYDRGETVPDDGARVLRELDAAVSEVIQLSGTRTAQTISERERSELPVAAGGPAQCARLEGSYGRQQVRTLVCLAVAAGRFVKVQVTSPLRTVVPVDTLTFVAGVTQAARGA